MLHDSKFLVIFVFGSEHWHHHNGHWSPISVGNPTHQQAGSQTLIATCLTARPIKKWAVQVLLPYSTFNVSYIILYYLKYLFPVQPQINETLLILTTPQPLPPCAECNTMERITESGHTKVCLLYFLYFICYFSPLYTDHSLYPSRALFDIEEGPFCAMSTPSQCDEVFAPPHHIDYQFWCDKVVSAPLHHIDY